MYSWCVQFFGRCAPTKATLLVANACQTETDRMAKFEFWTFTGLGFYGTGQLALAVQFIIGNRATLCDPRVTHNLRA